MAKKTKTSSAETCFTGVEFYDMSKTSIGKNTKIGKGSVIFTNVIIGNNGSIGKNCKICSGVIIGHYTKIGDNTVISAESIIGNDCSIEALSHIGRHNTIRSGSVFNSPIILNDIDDE